MEEYTMGPLEQSLEQLRQRFAESANMAISVFDWSQTGPDAGACGDIADAFEIIINTEIPDAVVKHVSSYDDDDAWESAHHTLLLVMRDDEKIIVDVPHFYYQRWSEQEDRYIQTDEQITKRHIEINQEGVL